MFHKPVMGDVFHGSTRHDASQHDKLTVYAVFSVKSRSITLIDETVELQVLASDQ